MNSISDPLSPVNRFSNKVNNYIKYRPHYPNEIITKLKEENILKENSIIADIGSGTGILTELFLNNKNTAFGIEPNKEMREAGEKLLNHFNNFISTNGTAESTTLEEKSVDIITAGQAFHWFDKEKARIEFLKILKPAGYVVLVWNVLKKYKEIPLLRAYEQILMKYGTDYKKVRHENITNEELRKFYGDSGFKSAAFYNEQIFDYEGLKGRLLSASYTPSESNPVYVEMLDELKKIFDEYNIDGKVKFEYDTNLYWGRLI